jgi:transmembrane sensor
MESSSQALKDTATQWLQKRELGPWNESDEAELGKWLEDSTANRITFLKLEAAWEEMGRLKALAPGLPRHTIPTPEQLKLGPTDAADVARHSHFLKSRWPWALAASILFVVGGASVVYWQFIAPSYHTPLGGLTSVPLTDGSSVTLNTATRIRVQMTQTQRHIDLTEGEAFFDVAKDSKRPFTVTAGDRTITAVGTGFSVRRNGANLQVTVTEGKVKIQGDAPHSPDGAILTAGTAAYVGPTGVTVRQQPESEIEDTLSWRTGYLIFRDTALPRVIAEFNRYNESEIAIEDPAVNAIQLTGKFRATNADALIRLLEKSFHVSARRDGPKILLSVQVPATE